VVKVVKYFRESSFGPITLYTGRMGSGLTLGAVMRMVKASKGKNPPGLVSNCTLNGLNYEPINYAKFIENIDRYLSGHYLLLFDSGYSYFASRIRLSRVLVQFFGLLRKGNSKAILTTSSGLEVIDKGIRDQVTDIVFVSKRFPRTQKVTFTHYRRSIRTVWAENTETRKMERCTELYWKPISRCLVKRSGKYWKYYDTTMIVIPTV